MCMLKYLTNYQNFYYFNRDNDFSDSGSNLGDTVDESVWSLSHELRCSKLVIAGPQPLGCYFKEDRDRLYGIRNRIPMINRDQLWNDIPDHVISALALVG